MSNKLYVSIQLKQGNNLNRYIGVDINILTRFLKSVKQQTIRR